MANFSSEVFTPASFPGPTGIVSSLGSTGGLFLFAAGTSYINWGYYVAGATIESWVTSGAPGTSPNPNTGHAVTDIEYAPVNQTI
jgi:hypothetical protein